MRYSQKMLYVCEQLKIFEEAIVSHSHEKYVEAFEGKDSVSIGSPEATKAFIYQHFKYYEGPLMARYMLIIQLYSIFERYSIMFSAAISAKDSFLNIKDLNGGQNFKGIKTYYTKVFNLDYKYWSELDALRQVRNLIAHCDGYVTYSEQKNKISRLACLDPDLIILDDERLAMNEEFIKRSLRAVFRFFDIVEPIAHDPDGVLDLSWGHINQFRAFDLAEKTEQAKAADA